MDFENDIKNCVRTLEAGGIILYPTDTIWGLGCDATDTAAVEKLFLLKHRPVAKSMIILLADARDVLQYVAAPPPDIIAILEGFEEPTTVVYDHGLELAENVLHPDGSVAIRVTRDPFCKALIKRFRKPIVSTSANFSGAPTPAIFGDINPQVVNGAGYVVRFRQDDNATRQPSAIIRINDEGEVTKIR
jgi:L-threonylcarbamoyladenylate synthase